ncbi:MAG: hypothetical protein QGH33_19840, partial [Pirellulaceae bacterium]|nr:hypothetical protein [Pirellulaceae bacterium]
GVGSLFRMTSYEFWGELWPKKTPDPFLQSAQPPHVLLLKETGKPRSRLRMFALHDNYYWRTR